MLRKTALLIVSNPKQISQTLSSAGKQVKNTLYIQLQSALSEPFGKFHLNCYNSWPKLSRVVHNVYSQAAKHCNNLDVRVLLSGLKYDVQKIHTNKPIDVIIFDKSQNQSEIDHFITNRIENVAKEYDVIILNTAEQVYTPDNNFKHSDESVCKHVVLGGTFDRLHEAHKLLLSEAALRASEKITVGVTGENMIHSKTLWELIEDTQVRIKKVSDFMSDICSEIHCNVVPIADSCGPSIADSTMEMIIVSDETVRGGLKINEIRKTRNMEPLKIISIELIDHPDPKPFEENKISSSTNRIRLLGTLLNEVKPNDHIPKSPYVIGLTGGIASGKTGVSKHLENLGAYVISADTVGHNVYKPGKPCYQKLLEHFGPQILSESGEVNRKALGEIVFKDSEELNKLNSIVWPAIAEDVNVLITSSNKKVVVIEAAVLLTAGWDKNCHEIWTTMVPREEALKRLLERNNLTEEQAKNRIDSQPPNKFYVKQSNVVIYPYWEVEHTKEQVLRAWKLLQGRIES